MPVPTSLDETGRMDLLTLCGISAALTAAHETGLLDHVLRGPRTAAACAETLHLDARMAAIVLDVLVASGLIYASDGCYGNTGSASSWLAKPGMLAYFQAQFAHTSKALRSGQALPGMDLDRSAEQREVMYKEIVAELGRVYADSAALLATHVTGKPQQILDVGCGSGVWSLAVANRFPGAHVTGLDFPAVLDAFSSLAQQMGLASRISKLPGDMFAVVLPNQAFDLVIIANVLRLETPARAESLLTQVAAALRPGGKMLIVDALAAGTPAKDLMRTTYALHLALRTQDGRVHSSEQIKQWMHRAQLTNLNDIDCGVQKTAIGAILGEKPIVMV